MTIIIVSLLILFVLLTCVFLKTRQRKKIKQSQKEGLAAIIKLKKLITYVQQHRGLTAAWLGGDTKVSTKLDTLKKEVLQESRGLAQEKICTDERWIAFTDHWQRLLNVDNTGSISNSFEQHTLMIRNLMYLLEDAAESSYLAADNLPELPHIGFVWRETVSVIESIGQSRAIGSSVTAQSFCSSVDKVRLSFLLERMKEVTEVTLHELSYLPNEKSQHQLLVDTAINKVNELSDIISEGLVNAPLVLVDSGEYFNLATDAMTTMNDIFDHQIKQMKHLL